MGQEGQYKFNPAISDERTGNKVFLVLAGEGGLARGFLIDVPPGKTLIVGKDKNGDFSAYLEPGQQEPNKKAMNAAEVAGTAKGKKIVPIDYSKVAGADKEALQIQGQNGKMRITAQYGEFKAEVGHSINELYSAETLIQSLQQPARPTTSVGYKPQ